MAVTKSVIIKPVTGDEANHLLRQSDDYLASLYPAESNHLVDPSALRGKRQRLALMNLWAIVIFRHLAAILMIR